MKKFITAALAATAIALTGCSVEQDVPVQTPEPHATVTTVATTEEKTVMGVESLPYEVQVYTSIARDMVAGGLIPRDRVSTAYVISDVQAQYGIDLTTDEANAVVKEILR